MTNVSIMTFNITVWYQNCESRAEQEDKIKKEGIVIDCKGLIEREEGRPGRTSGEDSGKNNPY